MATTTARRGIILGLVLGLALAFGWSPRCATASPSPGAPELELWAGSSGVARLVGPRSSARFLLTERLPDGAMADRTDEAVWSVADPSIAAVNAWGRVTPVADGSTEVTARWGGVERRATVEVVGVASPGTHSHPRDVPVSFRLEVIPTLSQANCNMGACHGTPTGKGGFRLSLRGYLPAEDHVVLTREAGMRRVNPFAPETSLILTKPLGDVPHDGGVRLQRDGLAHRLLSRWIAQGMPDDPEAVKPVALRITPGERTLHAPNVAQRLAVEAVFPDGTIRDVTDLCYFDVSRPDLAEVSADGQARFRNRGEAAVIAHYLDLVAIARLTHLVEVPGFTPTPVPNDSLVDRAVFAKLNRMRIPPSPEAEDHVFVRRLALDLLGRLPTPEEVAEFENDPRPDRHARLVDRFVERPEFADFWGLKLADVLRANSRLLQPKGARALARWLRDRVAADTPMNQVAAELVTASGSTFANPAANYYRVSRDVEAAVETTAQLWLGVRIQCAKCHNHPFERWTQDDYYGFAAFFARIGRKPGGLGGDEVIFAQDGGEVIQPRTGRVMPPKALGGPVLADGGDQPSDRRARLAAWLTREDNPFFARMMVNRVWYHVMGRGIVEPVDDFRDSNPPVNDQLLDDLEASFIQSHFSLKHLVRTIASSRTYRLSAEATELNAGDDLYFSKAVRKLLPAEVLLDAISTLTDSPTVFPNQPPGTRAVQLAEEGLDDPFLKTFGKPARELACECERESDSNLSQALQLIGGETVHAKLRDDAGRMARLAESDLSAEAIVEQLYRIALSRPPSDYELATATRHLVEAQDRRAAVEDLGWVLINSKEFLFRH
ncbi:protein of unknown function DUF1549 [Isosphaera pallida ATCC 43644]|uniref:BIG2 domain-containing protein n=1 Tax=Isosphaera pallida (strain ATCC 43644 / DSM 9630 / IS1B) TaxID=575540 RepID=E8QXS1_ISOPI|nr:DUF1553 domain-containing protein [Isosphaera pallida]ADV64108.1 protein of unknown function DUF1549 [Isosphaera pallida ATCC 43644]